MSKALCKMNRNERTQAVSRRIANKTKGLGYWAAMDAQVRELKKAVRNALKSQGLIINSQEDQNEPS